MGKQVEVSVPQRCEAVLKLLRREEPAAQIARRLGVSEPTLYRWRDDFPAGGRAALGSRKGAGDRRERQIKELRQAYQVMRRHRLLQKRRSRVAELYQASKLYELLPQGPKDLWQMDVTYIHIPGHGWWYAVTVIDYYSRYLLACHLTPSYCAIEAIRALGLARQEAERIHGPLGKIPFLVTDNGPSFIARRFGAYIKDLFSHVRIQYRTPTQLGLLERFHKTLKEEEVYWRLYDSPAHCRQCLAEFRDRYNRRRPHWALVPEAGGDPLVPEEVYAGGRTIRIPRWQGWAKEAKEKLEAMMREEMAA